MQDTGFYFGIFICAFCFCSPPHSLLYTPVPNPSLWSAGPKVEGKNCSLPSFLQLSTPCSYQMHFIILSLTLRSLFLFSSDGLISSFSYMKILSQGFRYLILRVGSPGNSFQKSTEHKYVPIIFKYKRWKIFNLNFILCICVFCLYVCRYMTYMPGTHWDLNMASDPQGWSYILAELPCEWWESNLGTLEVLWLCSKPQYHFSLPMVKNPELRKSLCAEVAESEAKNSFSMNLWRRKQ